jgi:hypothetical protein
MLNSKLNEISKKLINRYEESKRKDETEPTWILSPYDIAYNFMKDGVKSLVAYFGEESEEELLKNALDCLEHIFTEDLTLYNDGLFPTRIIHDGFKFGTPSWIFMNRKNSKLHVVKPAKDFYYQDDIYVVSRPIPPEILKMIRMHPELDSVLYCGYSLNNDIKVDIGPCNSLDNILEITGGTLL